MNHRQSVPIALLARALALGATALLLAAAARPAGAQDSLDLEATIPALPDFPEFTVRAFRTDGFAARSLAAEPDDPPWSGPMEARIRELLDTAPSFALERIEVECRTTRCGLLAVHDPAADRAAQSALLTHLQREGIQALGFDGSMAASYGQTAETRYTVAYLEGFRNLGPAQPLALWLLVFGLAHDPREQLLVGEEIVQAGSLLALPWLEPWLRAASVNSRANAAYVLARYSDPRGLETLEQIVVEGSGSGLLGAADAGVSSDELDHAAWLIGILADPGSFEALWRVLGGPLPNGYPSAAVERALLRTVDASAIPFLIRELGNRNAFLRGMAIQVLAEIRAVEALPEIARLAEDTATPFRGSQTTVGMLARQAQAILRIEALATGLSPGLDGL